MNWTLSFITSQRNWDDGGWADPDSAHYFLNKMTTCRPDWDDFHAEGNIVEWSLWYEEDCIGLVRLIGPDDWDAVAWREEEEI